MRHDHPLAKEKLLTLEMFCAFEHVLVSYHGGQFYGATDGALHKVGLKRQVALSITSFYYCLVS